MTETPYFQGVGFFILKMVLPMIRKIFFRGGEFNQSLWIVESAAGMVCQGVVDPLKHFVCDDVKVLHDEIIIGFGGYSFVG